MKKKIFILLPLLGVIGLSSCGVRVNTVQATNVEVDTGSIHIEEKYQEETSLEVEVEIPEEELDGRSVDERWREHSCSIKINQRDEQHRFESYEPGDYIFHVEYELETPFRSGYVISWNANFYIWDDMEVRFEFDNGYKTRVEKTHNPLGRDSLELPREDCWKRGLKFATITKIFVRTVD